MNIGVKTQPRVILVGDDVAIARAGVKCQGCKGIASRLDFETSLMLRGGDESLLPPAFECPRCEVIIFEEEFDEGRFVPPQFRIEGLPGRANSRMLTRR